MNQANIQGYLAILLWSFSALFVSWTPQIPPLLLTGLTSAAGFLFFALVWVRTPAKLKAALRQPWQIWLLYFAPIVVVRSLYMTAFKTAPIIEANLLNYLWPLMIVFLSAAIDHTKLKKKMYIGATACFIGLICIGFSKGEYSFSLQLGHFLAITAAFVWAIYSIMTRRFHDAPLDMFGIMCLIGALIFIPLHLFLEQPLDIHGITALNWAGTIILGVTMPLGYILWDKAMTHGARETIAVGAYYTPLLSTGWLILFSDGHLTPLTLLAAALILGGTLYARL